MWTKGRVDKLGLTVPATFTGKIESATLYQHWITNFARGTMPLTQ